MAPRSQPGKAGYRRTKSFVRRPRPARSSRRFYAHFAIGVLFALLVSSRQYQTIFDPSIPPTAGLTGGGSEPSVTPSLPFETQSAVETTATLAAAVQTAIALESVTPEPTEPGSEAIPKLLPTSIPTSTPPPRPATPQPPVLYYTQAGDTLSAVAVRFGVLPEEIASQEPLPQASLLNPGLLLFIPPFPGETSPAAQLFPDSEIVFSPSAIDFDVETYVQEKGGYLSTYSEYLGSTGHTSGAAIIKRIAIENSINPRILLALLEERAHWVLGQPSNLAETLYPMGALDRKYRGLWAQLTWTVNQLSVGYYGWREGRLTDLTFPNGGRLRLEPTLNAGTVAIQYLYSHLHDLEAWGGALYAPEGLPVLYEEMFGNPWLVAQSVEPLFPATLAQPEMLLPFMAGQVWSLTGGPHAAWNKDGAWAALDFAPPSTESGCVPSDRWVTAAATGLVTRAERGVVVVDLDGDGHEQTGWAMVYLHIASKEHIRAGEWVEAGGNIGHPSCEGGAATGTHVHVARKYNGEWIAADGPMSFDLSGWVAVAGEAPYKGGLLKGDIVVQANTYSSAVTNVWRNE